MDCCDIYSEKFDEESAKNHAQEYRESGLDGASAAMLATLVDRGIDGARVVDFGGGIGAFSLELLKAGAAEAVNVELSQSYRLVAAALAQEASLADRIEMVAGDAIEVADEVGPGDVVVMHRVVCCYADGEELMKTAIRSTRRLLAVSYPSIHPISSVVFALDNFFRARRGSAFRAYVHPDRVLALPDSGDFTEIFRRRRPVWSARVWERHDD